MTRARLRHYNRELEETFTTCVRIRVALMMALLCEARSLVPVPDLLEFVDVDASRLILSV